MGACSAAVSGENGHTVMVYDVDQEKIANLGSGDPEKINISIREIGLPELLIKNRERITFTTDYALVERFLDTTDVIFMCLPTPEVGETGESDLSYYMHAGKRLASSLAQRNDGAQTKYVVIVNKSTVPISMVDQTTEIMDAEKVTSYGVVSNPEFLVEGKAIAGTLHPDRIVVGARHTRDFEIMRSVYQKFCDNPQVTYIEVTPEEAAAGKLLANFYLFTKLAVCFDVMGRTCETFSHINFENIKGILATDPRIGTWGFENSLYAGGSCFIKDARSLTHQLGQEGQNTDLVESVYEANKRQLQLFIERGEKEGKISWKDARVTILGVTFKSETNDIRNSPSATIVAHLLEAGVGMLTICDPAGIEAFQKLIPQQENIRYTTEVGEDILHADVIIIATDWKKFRAVGDMLLTISQKSLIMDGRRLLKDYYTRLKEAGYSISAVGSPYVKST